MQNLNTALHEGGYSLNINSDIKFKYPIIIYNYKNFWGDLINLIENLINANFAGENMREAYKIINNYNDLEKILETNE